VLDALDGSADMYVESIGQVRAPRWSKGRFALTGDAAWCASPVSGMGTSVSMVGAYVLAGELAADVDHRDAFAGYERIAALRRAGPEAPSGRAAHRESPDPRRPRGTRTSSSGRIEPAGQKLGGQLFSPPADTIELPDYEHLDIAATTSFELPAFPQDCGPDP
jgi:2-polyprenyl-6-methoxyphenol hydroxylase-like FAD-dependent oxidoreductase